jgi:hypothetical protein
MDKESSDKESPAERYYKNHLNAVSKYQKEHKEERSIIMKRYRENIKKNHPDKYAALLESKRKYYQSRKNKLTTNLIEEEKWREPLESQEMIWQQIMNSDNCLTITNEEDKMSELIEQKEIELQQLNEKKRQFIRDLINVLDLIKKQTVVKPRVDKPSADKPSVDYFSEIRNDIVERLEAVTSRIDALTDYIISTQRDK